jgi:diguanylate cyclase (GGDEF)-like protein
VVEDISGHSYSNNLIPVLNAAVRFGFFFTTMLLVSEVKSLAKLQNTLATTDGLTGLLNARAFKDLSQTILHLAERHNHPVVLGYIDLDNFKSVNDHSGHSEGDRALQTVAKTLAGSVRAVDIVGRLGGDEFAILLPETNSAGAEELFGRIRERLIQEVAARGWPISFSIGVAVFPVCHPDIEELLKIADRLMYVVKNSGKNNVIFEEQFTGEKGAEDAA